MEKEAKDLNRRQLLFAAEEAEKEKANLRRRLMLAEAIIEKKVILTRTELMLSETIIKIKGCPGKGSSSLMMLL